MFKKKEYLLFVISVAILAAFVAVVSRNKTARYLADRLFSKKDDFQSTTNTVSLDKTSYTPGDDILLRLKFESKSAKRTEVRYFGNLEHTFTVALSFRSASLSSREGISEAKLPQREPGSIESVILAGSKRTAEIRVKGKLSESKDSYIIEFPDLNSRFSVVKATYTEHGQLWLGVYLMPVNPGIGDALEDYMQAVPLLIVSPKA
ncbi:MAG: hypothetical protein PHV33_12010 [Elusimicrobiales bacterium]|nr:hypothetical protein [Elusimicrobiales bacterium]